MFRKPDRQWLLAGLALLGATLATVDAQAQATRTWVSGVGDDVNPCSRTAPCKTFAGAISKTADGGEIDALDPGGFGTVTITKSITIDGGGTMASILASGTTGVIINGPGINVVLRNLSINGAGTVLGTNGVRFVNGRRLTLHKVNVQNFSQEAVLFTPTGTANLVIQESTLRAAGFGLRVQPAGGFADVLVADTVIEGNASAGVRVDDGTSILMRNSVAQANGSVGFNAVSSAGRAVDAAIVNSIVSNNGANGFVAQVPGGGGSVSMAITDSSSLQNAGDGVLSLGATIRLANSRIWANGGTGINAAGGTILSMGNNLNQANGAAGGPSGTFATQ